MTPCIASTTNWTASENGYPMYVDKATGKVAHESRIVYARQHGLTLADIAGKIVMHKCDNPSCVNPDHLVLGTQSDNVQDMWNKGRHPGASNQPKGEQHFKAKLTWEIVRAIRADNGRTYGKELAKKYAVSPSTVSLILLKKIWKE